MPPPQPTEVARGEGRIQKYLGWEPSIRLRDGLAKTYAWIQGQYRADRATAAAAPVRRQMDTAIAGRKALS